ncbi:hypothetical protein [Gandjariella thermophila]|nr:hypothetical protein [Gandjariella thermophila]
MSGQHVYRDGNQWGMTVDELAERLRAERQAETREWPAVDPDAAESARLFTFDLYTCA